MISCNRIHRNSCAFQLKQSLLKFQKDKRKGCTGLREFVNKYALPEMIIKLRQGVGRLIRKENDTGVVSILDSRAAYGFYSTKVSSVLSKYPRVDTIEDVHAFMKNVKTDSYFENQSSQTEV